MLNPRKIRCPKCGTPLIEVDPFEMDVFRGSGIYGCPKCETLWLYEVVNTASTTELLTGWGNQWASTLKPYTPKYCMYPEMKKAKMESRCKNCGVALNKLEHERLINALEKRIRELQEELEKLKEQKRIMDEGFCGVYCYSKYHGEI